MANSIEFTNYQHKVTFIHSNDFYDDSYYGNDGDIHPGKYTFSRNDKIYNGEITRVDYLKILDSYKITIYFNQNDNIFENNIRYEGDDHYNEIIRTNVTYLEFSKDLEDIENISDYYFDTLDELILPEKLINCFIYSNYIENLVIPHNAKDWNITVNTIKNIIYNAIDCEYFNINIQNTDYNIIVSDNIKSIPTGNFDFIISHGNKDYVYDKNIKELYPNSVKYIKGVSKNVEILHRAAFLDNTNLSIFTQSKLIPNSCYEGCNELYLLDTYDIEYIGEKNNFIYPNDFAQHFPKLKYAYRLKNIDSIPNSCKCIYKLVFSEDYDLKNKPFVIPRNIERIELLGGNILDKIELYGENLEYFYTTNVLNILEIKGNVKSIDASKLKAKEIIISESVIELTNELSYYVETITFYGTTKLSNDIFALCSKLNTINIIGELMYDIDFTNTKLYKNLPRDEYGAVYYNNYLIGYDSSFDTHIGDSTTYSDFIIKEECTKIFINLSLLEYKNIIIHKNINHIKPSKTFGKTNIIINDNVKFKVIDNIILDDLNTIIVCSDYQNMTSLEILENVSIHEDLNLTLKGNITNITFKNKLTITHDITFNNCVFLGEIIHRSGTININSDNPTTIPKITIYHYDRATPGHVINGNIKEIKEINIDVNYKICTSFSLDYFDTAIRSANSTTSSVNAENFKRVYFISHDSEYSTTFNKIYISEDTKYVKLIDYNTVSNTYIYFKGSLEKLLKLNADNIRSRVSNYYNFYYWDATKKSYVILCDTTNSEIKQNNYTEVTNCRIFDTIQYIDDSKYPNMLNYALKIPNSWIKLNLDFIQSTYIDFTEINENIDLSVRCIRNDTYNPFYIIIDNKIFNINSDNINFDGKIRIVYNGTKDEFINNLFNTNLGNKILKTYIHNPNNGSTNGSSRLTIACYDGNISF